MPSTEHTLAVGEGARCVVRVFESSSTSPPRGTVVIPSAMGVAQSYYGRFAEWLSTQGYCAITFDYRGIGRSAPSSLRGFEATIFDWARDCDAVIEFAKQRWPELPLFWVGHSLGGQLLGLLANRARIERVMTVATGNGYWLENSWPTRRFVWWMWYVAVPVATRLVGYFPGKRLRKVGDLPRGVIEQWRRWCLDREYVVGVEGENVRASYSSVEMPMVCVSFTDDEMMSEQSVRSLHRLYSHAPIEYRRIAPRDIGVRRIGHFGFFRPQFEQTLWTMVPRWLEAQ
ncbi:putative alpha/beta hydrolase [Povalibacter uvarum]|uniref:Putative alpha/beta hydrolase n=1 Tax=Povalibacter uvarum TaxID=732238 RepID=A0A841HQW7_9GAMM|nr:alpha/beta fold hydrolase [Povalibacter uvarum]MBB6095276.1 putative alpha/beta hydrolase [Povalibacter uvarum]